MAGMFFEGLAMHRKDVEWQVRSAVRPVLQHFLKIVLFNSRDRLHWYKEIEAYINDVLDMRLKPNNRRHDKIVREIFLGWLEQEWETRNQVKKLIKQYPRVRLYEDIDLRDLQNIQERWVTFVDFICDKILKDEFEVSVEELRKVLGR
jgi:hypothetical protein